MKYLLNIPKAARRATELIAALVVAGLIAAVAVAVAPGASARSSAVLTSDSARAAVVFIPECQAADLGVWFAVDQGNGTAGSAYYPLQFTNLSKHTCSLTGFPGVSAINSNGKQLGRPAFWSRRVTPVRTVVLAPGATAHAELQYLDVAVQTAPGCRPLVTASELRVYPPGQRSATHAVFDLPVCSHARAVYMNVGPIVPGVGTIDG
jgi:hypothetical protein